MGFALQPALRGSLTAPAAPSRVPRRAQKKEEQQPWGFQQLISLLSGFIGSLLSVNAYSQLRDAKREVLRARPTLASRARIVQQLGGSLLDAEAGARRAHEQSKDR